jgi:hypothetical protein
VGVAVVVVELQRKNKEDAEKKVKERAEKQEIRELHERHLQTEKVHGCHLRCLIRPELWFGNADACSAAVVPPCACMLSNCKLALLCTSTE